MNHVCRICSGRVRHQEYLCREKMFGLGDQFLYFQCGDCGCLQIAQVPQDLGPYYPQNYYSFRQTPFTTRGLKAWLAALRDRAYLTGQGRFGLWLNRRRPIPVELHGLGRVPLRLDMRILDVGCGRGQWLSLLHRAGFRRLLGIDPYLPGDVEVVPGLWVRKQSLEMLNEAFDLIMLHHVFEHVADGREMLRTCRTRLAPGGRILLRLPTVECAAWERYRENWVQLDAPRHLFLHTRASLRLLAEQAGLRVLEERCDSGEFQFWASEIYQRGLPLTDKQGRATMPWDHFSAQALENFRKEAVALNAANRGDQMAVLLTQAGN